jgi:alkylated DNA repair dioxygenase AlkB
VRSHFRGGAVNTPPRRLPPSRLRATLLAMGRPDQLSLLGREEPQFDARFGALRRTKLAHGAWVDYRQGWLSGHTTLFEQLLHTVAWETSEQQIYDRTVETPRLIAGLRPDASIPPLLDAMRRALGARYRSDFTRISFALYRDGRDSVAYHGDRIARELPNALVATVSVGAPRRFWLRPHPRIEAPAASPLAYNLGWGDLIVMGGSCQRTWQHAIPKVAHAEPRIAIMFRPMLAAP